ncbi:hypothetical protein [Rhodococcus sp. 311R]|uniref:hypothetical protein n=1 Tax=Rhodococcus sp. 311R TaxID=1617904 RepID=UPI00067F4F57|nr:hypothetical protein [Rhodococcus sp. 311R]
MYGLSKIEHPLDERLVNKEQAAVLMGRSITAVMKYLNTGRLTRYDLNGHCLFFDRREVEILAAEIHSGNVTRR